MRYFICAFVAFFMSIGGAANPSKAEDATPTFHCDLRTPAGDTLGLVIMAASFGDGPMLFIYSRHGDSWPGDEETSAVALFERAGDTEFQFELGNKRIRMDRAGQIKNITVWSFEDGEVEQPLAFGFCVNDEISSKEGLATSNSEPLQMSGGDERCHGTQYSVDGPIHFSFRVTHGTNDDDALTATFFDGAGHFGRHTTVSREILQNAPETEHPELFMGVAKFASQPDTGGPRGMEVSYFDRRSRLMTTIMAFNTITGTDGPAYAICSAEVDEIEATQ